MDMWDEYAKVAVTNRVPFIRKFDSKEDNKMLNKIDKFSDEIFYKSTSTE